MEPVSAFSSFDCNWICGFMREFYQNFYKHPSDEAIKDSEEYKEKNRIRFELENEVEEMLGGNSTAEYKIFDDFLTAFYDEYEVLLEEMYLLGAYDRERMLR